MGHRLARVGRNEGMRLWLGSVGACVCYLVSGGLDVVILIV